MILVVETQHGDYLFADPGAAEAFAERQRQWWRDHCPGMGRAPIDPVPLNRFHRFRPDPEMVPLKAGPGQERCRRIARHVHRWWRARDAWWSQGEG